MTTLKSQALLAAGQLIALVALIAATPSQARSIDNEALSAVIPSPNQEFGDELDIQRMGAAPASNVASPVRGAAIKPLSAIDTQADSSNEASVPVYVSPFNRIQGSGATLATPIAAQSPPSNYEHRQESSHAPPNYAPSPSASAQSSSSSSGDLKTSASYGHHHHGGHHGYGYDHSGWLDMGAWTGGKGSFGWYADYPVGGKHHGYGRK